MQRYAVIKNETVVNLVVADLGEDGKAVLSELIPDADDFIETTNIPTFIGAMFKNEKLQPVSPFPSWIFSEETWRWDAPSPMPAENGPWEWNETEKMWQAVTDLPEPEVTDGDA
jgi:hypothetical protein